MGGWVREQREGARQLAEAHREGSSRWSKGRGKGRGATGKGAMGGAKHR